MVRCKSEWKDALLERRLAQGALQAAEADLRRELLQVAARELVLREDVPGPVTLLP